MRPLVAVHCDTRPILQLDAATVRAILQEPIGFRCDCPGCRVSAKGMPANRTLNEAMEHSMKVTTWYWYMYVSSSDIGNVVALRLRIRYVPVHPPSLTTVHIAHTGR